MAHAVDNAPSVSIPADLLAEAIEAIEDAGCGFWACKGETLDPIDMVTCSRCATLARLRTLGTGSAQSHRVNRPTITPREAAALDRLLDAYVDNEVDDPGMADLRTLYAKVHRLDQDHAAYEHGTGSSQSTGGGLL